MKNRPDIIVRGGGDLATGVIYKLWAAGFRVLILETVQPMAIRRQVALSEAVYDGRATVEECTAVHIKTLEQMEMVWENGDIPLFVDPDGTCIDVLKPEIVVDAIIAKKNLGTRMDMAPMTVGIGPGFTAGVDVHAVIESARGHNLGRVYYTGSAKPNTGIPGNIGGYTAERVIHSPVEGVLYNTVRIGSIVVRGQEIARIRTDRGEEIAIPATIPGIVRGLIRDGFRVTEGFKIADIDPRETELKNCVTISDKARCIAGGVLEAVCRHYAQKRSDANG